MNSGLAPPTHAVKIDGKGKSAGRGKDTSSSVPTSKRGNGVSLVSPSLKPILPGESGIVTSSVQPLISLHFSRECLYFCPRLVVTTVTRPSQDIT